MEKTVSRGGILPSGLVEKILFPRLLKRDCSRGFVLDGYPRVSSQLLLFERELKRTKRKIDAVVLLEVPAKTVVMRLSFRLQCPKCRAIYNLLAKPPKKRGVCDICGSKISRRRDDNPSSIRERLREYALHTKPVVSLYAKTGVLKRIDADPLEEDSRREISEVFRRIKRELKLVSKK